MKLGAKGNTTYMFTCRQICVIFYIFICFSILMLHRDMFVITTLCRYVRSFLFATEENVTGNNLLQIFKCNLRCYIFGECLYKLMA
jgi:hypothetical protein